MNWDGEHIDGMSNNDAMLLTDLRPSQAKPNAGCPCVAHAIARAVDHVAAPGAKGCRPNHVRSAADGVPVARQEAGLVPAGGCGPPNSHERDWRL